MTETKQDLPPPLPSTVFITGASRGLGLEFARQYAADGWNVIASCRAPQKAEALKALAKTHPSLTIEMLDVTDDKDITVLASKLKNKPIHLLINGAGIFSGAGPHITAKNDDKTQTFGSIDSTGWMKVLRTNAIGPIMVSQAFQQNLALAPGAKLAMISSRMGSLDSITRPGDIAYRTSKVALNAAMKSIALNLKEQGICVCSLHPGWVKTDMGSPEAPVEISESVAKMRQVLAKLTPENSGTFISYERKVLPW